MFKADGNVLHIDAPKVHGDVGSNTLAVYGKAQNKELTELLPGILSQLGPESLASLRKLAESYQAISAQQAEAQKAAENEGVPEVSGNFDEVEQGKDAPAETQVDQLD